MILSGLWWRGGGREGGEGERDGDEELITQSEDGCIVTCSLQWPVTLATSPQRVIPPACVDHCR